MNILHYLSRFRSRDGGVPRSVLDLCAELARCGHRVTLVTGGEEMVPAEWSRAMADAPGAPSTPRVLSLRPWRRIGRLDANERDAIDAALRVCDVAHLHVPWDSIGAQIGRRATTLGTPYLVTAHGMLDNWTMAHRPLRKRVFLAAGGRRYLDGAAAVHCTSSIEAEQSRRWFRGGRTVVAPLLTDLAPFIDEQALPPREARSDGGHLQVLFLGRLDPIKGIEDLLHATASMARAGVRASVFIAGDGDTAYRRSLERLTSRLKVAGNVRFLGHVSGETKMRLLRAADVAVLPSRHENFGVALIESLAAATPVVTTRGVNIWRELESSGGATIVPPAPAGSPDHGPMAEALAHVLRGHAAHRAELRAMGRRGREWVLRELAPGRVIERYETIYRDVVRDGAEGRSHGRQSSEPRAQARESGSRS